MDKTDFSYAFKLASFLLLTQIFYESQFNQ